MKKILLTLLMLLCCSPSWAATIVAATGAAGNWTSGGAWVGGVAPTAADDAQITATTTSLTIDAGAVCRSADFTGFTGTLTQGSTGTLTIGTSTSGISNIALNMPSGFTYAPNSASTITFNSTSATQQTISTAYTMGNMTVNSTSNGNYAITAALTVNGASTFTFTKGTLHMDGASDNSGFTHSFGVFNSNNGNTRSLLLGTATYNTSAATGWEMSNCTGLTLTAGTSTITIASNGNGNFGTINPSSGTFTWYNVTDSANNTLNFGKTGATHNFNTVTHRGNGNLNTFGTVNITTLTYNSNGSLVPTNTLTVTTLNRTGTASTTDTFTLAGNFTVTGTLTLAGNSTKNRLLVQSSVIGTQRTITNSGATMTWSNVDFEDIGLGTSFDASAITGGSGNCLGNTNITFTTPATQYLKTAVTANWSDATKWFLATNGGGGAGRVPLPQDPVVIDANSVTATSKTITIDLPRTGANIDFTGVANSPTFTVGATLATYGSLTLVSGMTWNGAWISLSGRSSHTVTSAGKTMATTGDVRINTGGTYALQDAFTMTGNGLNVYGGSTFTTNGYNVTAVGFGFVSPATINLGASLVTATSSGNSWNNGAGVTMNAGTSTISITDTSSSTKFITGAGATYYNMQFTTGGAGVVQITGNNTFNTLSVTGGTTKSFTFAAGSTNTLTGGALSFLKGASGNLITIASSSAGSAFTLSSATSISTDYISLKDSTASNATPFYAGANSTNVSGNTNWNFTARNNGNFFQLFN